MIIGAVACGLLAVIAWQLASIAQELQGIRNKLK